MLKRLGQLGFILNGVIVVLITSSLAQAQSNYIIDSNQSSIRIVTDKGGIARAAAHQHLISMRPIDGSVVLSSNETGTAQFTLRPAEFVVDQAAERALFPDIFTKPVPDKAIRGTRRNMLGRKLLDVDEYPEIKVSIELISLHGIDANYKALVTLKERTFEFQIPGTLTKTEDDLIATAEFNLSNPDLGLKVFSAMLGAISVGHDLKFIVEILANKYSN